MTVSIPKITRGLRTVRESPNTTKLFWTTLIRAASVQFTPESKKERAEESFHVFTTDWMFGPKPVDDDSEGGGAENEEEERLSFSSKLMEKDELRMEEEKEGLLPGFHQGETGCRRPSTPPLRSAIAPSYPGEKRISTHSVTFACPVNPYATSL